MPDDRNGQVNRNPTLISEYESGAAEVAPSDSVERARFHVAELDCAEEVLLLKQELGGAPGVQELDFDVLNACMTVAFDAGVTSTDAIIDRVAGIGMQARLWRDAGSDEGRTWFQQHTRLLLTLASGLLMLSGVLLHAFASGSLLTALGYSAIGSEAAVPAPVRIMYVMSICAGFWLVFPKAWLSVRRLRADMNLLMCVAVIGAILLGEWLEAAMVTFLFSTALLLEQWSLGRARRAIAALVNLTPTTARTVGADCEHEVRIENVAVGAIVQVRPTERIPLDGIVRTGTTRVDQAPITGESVPVAKQPGDEVFAGTINQDGTVEFEVTKAAADTTLARILHMVSEAQSRRAPSEQWVETFARYYTPAMMALALLIAVLPPLLFSADWNQWFYSGLVVLVIACPCALVISTPVSLVSAMTAATRNGVLVKGGRFLEAAAGIQAVALDKTGTLTRGRPTVLQVVPFNGHSADELLERAAAMEAHSQHPLARAILRRVHDQQIAVAAADEYRLLEGKGAEGIFAGKRFWIGSHRLMHEEKVEEPRGIHERALQMENAGHTVVAIGNDNHVCGLIGIADDVREEAAAAVEALRAAGVSHIVMLTGDNEQTAREVARITGVDEHLAELLPEDKVRAVEELRNRFGSVAMVGDGVNDAPAMAVSTLGIAMGAIGTDAAIETADIALMSDELAKLPWLIGHARRTLSVIRQNIAFALGLKIVFVALALLGMASLWMAIAADMGASLLVIFNGLRLLKP